MTRTPDRTVSTGEGTNGVRPESNVLRMPAANIRRALPPNDQVAVFHRGAWRTWPSYAALKMEILADAVREEREQLAAQARDREEAVRRAALAEAQARRRQAREAAAERRALAITPGMALCEFQAGFAVATCTFALMSAVLL